MADVKINPTRSSAIDAALRRARDAEAAHYEARLTFSDAKLLRLSALWDEVAPVFAAAPAGLVMAELTSKPDEEPRLWVDLVTSVIMAPDPGTYRMIRDGEQGREILCETTRFAEIAEFIKRYVAHRNIAAARQPSHAATTPEIARRTSGELLLALSAGMAIGVTIGAGAVIILINILKL